MIVAVRVNGDHKLFMWYERKDGTLTEPAPHMLQVRLGRRCWHTLLVPRSDEGKLVGPIRT